jgi:hypothetical protein
MWVHRFMSSLSAHFHPAVWWTIAVAFVGLFQVTQRWLDGLYALSRFPVPYYVGQTTFDAARLKSYYAVLIEQGTLERYVGVQVADYAYMATVLLAFVALTIAAYRSFPKGHWLKPFAFVMIFVAALAPVFDALENPAGFADWLVYPYSAFACAKFAIYGLTYLWVPVAVGIALLSWGGRTFAPTS